MDDIKRAELLTACLMLREYLEPYVCEFGCDYYEYDKCNVCERDIMYSLEQLEEIIRDDEL